MLVNQLKYFRSMVANAIIEAHIFIRILITRLQLFSKPGLEEQKK